ncbi:MAG: nucleoside-diphosphate kinase [Candidatus Bipolaricaulia bacterium]
MSNEAALFFLKPDATARRAVGAAVVSQLLDLDVRLEVFCQLTPSKSFLAEKHYAIHKGKFFYAWLLDYVSSGPVVAAIIEGKGVVAMVRSLLGATLPEQADPSSMRGRFGIIGGLNVAHASDSPENGETEKALWGPLFQKHCAGAASPGSALASAGEYVDHYGLFDLVATEEYREVSKSLSSGDVCGTEALAAFRKLLARESDLDADVLARIAAVMVSNATSRKP